MESFEQESTAPPVTPFKPYEPRVRMVLVVQVGLFILGSGLSAVLFGAIALAMGWDPALSLTPESAEPARWQVRIQLGLAHAMAFCASGAFTVWMFYRSLTGVTPDWPDYLRLRKAPGLTLLALALLLMAVSVPFVLYSLNINQLIPLPSYFQDLEDQTESVLKGLLQMDHPGELLGNLIIIAVLPAIGEELVFRGVVQNQLLRRISQPGVAIALSAAIFSLAHFQLEGFLPRMVLGILLGWLYWKTQNFWIPVAGHFFNNGIQVVGQYLFRREVSAIDLEQDIQVPWQFAAISAFMIWAVARLITSHLSIGRHATY